MYYTENPFDKKSFYNKFSFRGKYKNGLQHTNMLKAPKNNITKKISAAIFVNV